MRNNYKANPIVAPAITRPGESAEHIGTRDVSKLLPTIFQTPINRKFLESTLEQLMTSGSLQALNYFVGGKHTGGSSNEKYLIDNRTVDNYQFIPAAINKDNSENITNVLTYDDLISALDYNEVQVNQHNRIFNEKGYTLDLPINYDMFINYHRYQWVLDKLPICDIAATSEDTINLDNILVESYYTTPELANGKTLELQNGMRIRFRPASIDRVYQTTSGNVTFARSVTDTISAQVYLNNAIQIEGVDYVEVSGNIEFATAPAVGDEVEIWNYYFDFSSDIELNAIYIVNGVGSREGIHFIKYFSAPTRVDEYGKQVWINQTIYSGRVPTGFDTEGEGLEYKPYDFRELKIVLRDYVVEDRGSVDQSAWARSNLWVHEDTVNTVCTFTDENPQDWITDETRGIRPIIEYNANIQKYKFGHRHIANVTHVIDSIIDPTTDIVGQTEWSYANFRVTDVWEDKGYAAGSQVKFIAPDSTATYWDCIESHANGKKPTEYQNKVYWRQIYNVTLSDDDLVLFINSGTSYSDKIYRVSGVDSENIQLTLEYTYNSSEGATLLAPYDKIMTIYGHNNISRNNMKDYALYTGAEWYWSGSQWIYAQQKNHRSESAKFELFDFNKISLGNNSVYENSNFNGDSIFDYAKSNSKFDDALGFSPAYVDYGNFPGYKFDIGLGAKRFYYNKIDSVDTYRSMNDANVFEEILGNYYYRNIVTGIYNDGWAEIRSGQPVKMHKQVVITDYASGGLTINIGTDNVNLDDKFKFVLYGNNLKVVSGNTQNTVTRETDINGFTPALFVSRGKTYTVETVFDSNDLVFLNLDGSALTDVTFATVSADSFTFTVDSTSDLKTFSYRLISNPTIQGMFYVDDNTNERNIEVYVNGEPITAFTYSNGIVNTNFYEKDDVVDVFWHSDSELLTEEGYFIPSDTHILNPSNDWLSNATYGDLINHLKQQMTNIPGFSGDYFGSNNYRHLPRIHEFGGTIRKQPYSTELLAQTLMDADTNPFSSLKFVSDSYKRFMASYLKKAQQLHKELSADIPVHELIDETLAQLNLGKNADSAFSNSNMALFRDYSYANYDVTVGQTPVVFNLPKTINTYLDTSNHIQVWVKDKTTGSLAWRSLIKDEDYTLTYNKFVINSIVHGGEVAKIHVRWYPLNSYSFIPPSAAKLGLVRPSKPSIQSSYDTNTTGSFTGDVIIKHDGSVHHLTGSNMYDRNSADFNIVDAAIWELETRIYNNLHADLDTVIDYKKIIPSSTNVTPYNWNDLTTALTPEFNKWKIKNRIVELQEDDYYDGGNRFTWNYSSVAPYIGSYRGIYNYYFNTDRPHTHPWEMFGYNKKPTWWDANYSWTDMSKRAALIYALKYGRYNNPSETPEYDTAYAYTNYDWSTNSPVDLSGNLSDPVSANVCASPVSVDASKPVEFGDWGPIENEWRKSSEYKIELFVALMRLRPLWVINNYFESTHRKIKFRNDIGKEIIFFNDTNTYDRIISKFSYTSFEDSIIETVNVKNTGNSYVDTPAINVYSNFGYGAVIVPIIEDNKIVSASVQNPGRDYQSRPNIVVSYGQAELEPVLLKGAKKYFNGMSNAVVEYARYSKTDIDDVITRFENLEFQPVIKAGGFINPNNQQFILESSQDKGRVFVPEENVTSFLHVSQPKEELFYGAVKITKAFNGYTLTGYDNNKQYFEYLKPNPNSKTTIINIDDQNYKKHHDFNKLPTTVFYNTTVATIQELYNFVLGYGRFLNSKGWLADWVNTAAKVVIWAQQASVGSTESFIPNVSTIQIAEPDSGYYDNINKKYDGVYNLIGKNGEQILSNRVIVARDILEQSEPKTTIAVKEISETDIYGVRLYKVELEHAFVFSNFSDFDDLIYDPALGQRHERVIWRGSRTKNWNGRLYSPGYIVVDNTIINNFDTTAREIDQYYSRGNTVNNQQLIDAARFNTGYNKPDWGKLTTLDDDTLFEFSQGTRKYRGTTFALDAFMRNNNLFGSTAMSALYEEWALRTADFGDTRGIDNTIEFELTKDLLTTSPQPIRFIDGEVNDVLTDITIDIDSNSPLLVSGTAGNNFRTRPAKTYTASIFSDEEYFARDFLTAGLPLTTETDYRVFNRADFAEFPNETKDAYDFSGEWQNITYWNNKTSYKFKDKVIYNGYVWEMLDPDGSSGLTRPNDPINIVGTISLPTVPANETVVIDGNIITLQANATTTSYNLIEITGTNNIGTTAVVEHGSTLVIGQNANTAANIQFANSVTTTIYNNIVKTGTNQSPQIIGSATKELIIDNVSIAFNDQTSSTANITALAALEDAFYTTWLINTNPGIVTQTATQRIQRLEALRQYFVTNVGTGAWTTFVNNYFADSNAGLDIDFLLTQIIGDSGTLDTAVENLIRTDVTIINNLLNRSYNAENVIAGTESVIASDILVAQTSLSTGEYITEFADYLKNNPTVTFTVNTIITSVNSSVYQTYNLTNIIAKINAAGIANVTASASANDQLVITKTPADQTVRFSLKISAATANSDVGFSSTTEIINSTSSNIVTTPNLTITQVIDQINAVGIANVTARTSPSNANLLQIISNAQQLYIGAGAANATIGLTQGITLGTVSVSSTPINSDISKVIAQINDANISGVTASNSNNKLKLTSTNDTLTIGAGTANTYLGLLAQTYSATQSTVSNVFNAFRYTSTGDQIVVFKEMENDPNIFSIWIADNSSIDSINLNYAVFQTMTMNMNIGKACAGIDAADDAQIYVTRPSGTVQAHNLQAGDYVLIRGSNTTPSIDGIHKVTSVNENNNALFYIDTYINKEGDTGIVYPLRNVRFKSYADLINSYNLKVNDVYKYNFAGYRQNNTRKPIYAFVDDDSNGTPAVYRFAGEFNETYGHYGTEEWIKVRNAPEQSRNDLINNVKIYDARRKSLLTTIETFDPAKGIIPGFLSKEIDFKTTADIASYNYDNVNGYSENAKAWNDLQVGLRWWDLTTAIYLDYEQGSLDYQQNNWGRLFDGSTIDVYEWTRSPVLPDQWEKYVEQGKTINGVIATGEAYKTTVDGEDIYRWAEQTWYNPTTKSTQVSYFFWVKNKTSIPVSRVYNTYQLARLIESPAINDISWCAATESGNLLLANVDSFITEDTVVQVNQLYDSNSLQLDEWTLVSDGDPDSYIPEFFHIRMRDSLVGYNKETKIYNYSEYSATTTYSQNQVVYYLGDYYICLASVLGIAPPTDTTTTYWKKIYDYTLPPDTPHDDISVAASQPVPDLSLHEFNRYGHQVKPRQSLFRDVVEARHNFVSALNEIFDNMCFVNEFVNFDDILNTEFREGEIVYKMNNYVVYKDYINPLYANNITPDYVVSDFSELPNNNTTAIEDGTIIKVRDIIHNDGVERPEIYRYVNGVPVLIWKKNGTIEFSEELWNAKKFGHGYDAIGFDTAGFDNSVENILDRIFDKLRYDVFVGRFKNLYNRLWFKCLYQAVTQNTTDDFAFKTTYTKLHVSHPVLTNKDRYHEYGTRVIEEYFNTIKPFHTKLRSVVDSNTYGEAAGILVTENYLEEITMKYEDHSTREWAGNVVLTGASFFDDYSVSVTSEFTTADVDVEYVFDGGAFNQPAYEGWGSELYPIDATENIRIRVQTNASGSTEDGNTRTFQIDLFEQFGLEEHTVIVDQAKAITVSNISDSDTVIEFQTFPGTTFSGPGVVWINNERIEYFAVNDSKLYSCVRGTRGTSATAHDAGSVIVNARSEYSIPAPARLQHYGDNLKKAYNDDGVSLSQAGSTNAHAFIRNSGFGTI